MRGGQLHDLGHRLRLQHVLRVLEDRVDVGLRGRENLELVFPESLRSFGSTFLHAVGSFRENASAAQKLATETSRPLTSGFGSQFGPMS